MGAAIVDFFQELLVAEVAGSEMVCTWIVGHRLVILGICWLNEIKLQLHRERPLESKFAKTCGAASALRFWCASVLRTANLRDNERDMN